MSRNDNQPDPPAPKTQSMLAWDERIFALLPLGVDPTLIAENLRLSPSQRLTNSPAYSASSKRLRGRAVTRFAELLRALGSENVQFVVIGGLALTLRGSSRVTYDLDICYARSTDNLERLARAVAPYHPRLRGAPDDLPFLWDALTRVRV